MPDCILPACRVVRPSPGRLLSPGRLFLSAAVTVVLACLLLGSPAAAGVDESTVVLQKRYDMAKAYYYNLSDHNESGKSRANWDNAIGKFRKVYLVNPKHDLALSSLFMMGRMYYEMYDRFKNPLDLGEAITYYQDVALLFPENRLADDALYLLGRMYLEDKKDRKRAAKTFSRIMHRYPDGDMADKAAGQLKNLKDVIEVVVPDKGKSDSRQAMVLPIKFWSTNNYTRVVIKTTAPVRFKEQLLEKDGNRPRRLYIDFANSRIAPAAWAPIPIQDGLLKQVRAGQFKPETVRVVLDIESISQYKIFSLQDPFRVVIDVKGKEKLAPARSPVIKAEKKKKKYRKKVAASRKKVEPVSQTPISLARQLGLGIDRIVIDPGHGGKDPGAIAKNGLKEKDIVLEVAKKLAIELKKNLNCEVIFTRTRDIFIPLEERTAIANTSKADLFISLHVNSAPTPKAKGVETYLLDLTTDEDSMRLAALENATSTSKMSDLQNILADLLNNNRKDESTRLAQYVQTNMVQGLKLRNLGVKQAPFYVLIGAQMPAILSEITFLSNPKEAKRLQRDDYLTSIAVQLAAGIEDYVADSAVARLN